MFSTDPRLAPGDVIAIQYRVWRHDGCADEFIERWIRAEIIDCEPGTWPLARLTDGQHTEVRRFMIWRLVGKSSGTSSRRLAA